MALSTFSKETVTKFKTFVWGDEKHQNNHITVQNSCNFKSIKVVSKWAASLYSWDSCLLKAESYLKKSHRELEVATDLFLCIVMYIWVNRLSKRKEKNCTAWTSIHRLLIGWRKIWTWVDCKKGVGFKLTKLLEKSFHRKIVLR